MKPDIDNWLLIIKKEPHKLGHLLGYEKLTFLHNEWIKYCWDTKGARGLMAFRGSYKTTSVVVTGIIRYLLFKPNTRILIVRKTHEEACRVVKAVSKAFDKDEVIALFKLIHGIEPKKLTDKTNELLFNFKQTTTIEPSLTAKGINDAITGAHCDVVIADDIIGLQDKTSRAEREKTKESIRELAGNIIDPGSLSIWLGTKWAKGDGWDVIENFTEVKKYPESKFNDFIDKKEIAEKRKSLTPFLYAINYELELIADDSLLFKEPKYGNFEGNAVAHIDAAYGGSDTCALTIMSKTHAIGWVYHGNIQDWEGFVFNKINKYNCSKVLMEKNSDKGFLAKELKEKYGLRCETYTETMNKGVKISTYLYQDWEGLTWDLETDPNYMNQILDWKADSAGLDDAPDSAASLRREAFGKKEESSVGFADIVY